MDDKEKVESLKVRADDNCKKAREFYGLFWPKVMNLNYYCKNDERDKKVVYSGETIISFRTIAGAMIRLTSYYNGKNVPKSSKERLEKIVDADSKEVSCDLKKKFKEFYKLYHTDANFMPLPKTCSSTSLNSLKGRGGKYHDFPDLFFSDIKKYFCGDASYREALRNVTSKESDRCACGKLINRVYLDSFGSGEKGWKNFVELNYLEDFFEDDNYSEFVKLAPKIKKFPYKKRKLSEDDKTKCVEEINEFLDNAIKIIEARSKRIECARKKNNYN